MAELVVTIYIRIIASSQSGILNNDMRYVKIGRWIDPHVRVKVKFLIHLELEEDFKVLIFFEIPSFFFFSFSKLKWSFILKLN